MKAGEVQRQEEAGRSSKKQRQGKESVAEVKGLITILSPSKQVTQCFPISGTHKACAPV